MADMGRCKLLSHGDESLHTVFGKESTSNCLSRGVPSRCYVAPEVWSGGNITEKVDVYSFGVICWSILQNREPGPCNIDAKRPASVDTSTLELETSWPCELNALLVACFNHDPTKRPTFRKIVTVLDRILHKPALSSSNKSPRSTPSNSPRITGKSLRTSGKDDGWMPRMAEAIKHDNHEDELKPELPGAPAVLNVTRRSFAEKFTKVVADVLPLFRNAQSGSLIPSRRGTSVSTPNTQDMTRKSMAPGKMPAFASQGSSSTAALSTHTLGSLGSTLPHIIKATCSLPSI